MHTFKGSSTETNSHGDGTTLYSNDSYRNLVFPRKSWPTRAYKHQCFLQSLPTGPKHHTSSKEAARSAMQLSPVYQFGYRNTKKGREHK